MKNKDTKWLDGKIQSIKKRKRKLTSDTSGMNSAQVKNEKQSLKKEKRSYKRAEKQNWKKEAQRQIDRNND